MVKQTRTQSEKGEGHKRTLEWKRRFDENLDEMLERTYGEVIRQIPKEGSTTPARIARNAQLHPRTVKKLLRVILYLQGVAPKLKLDQSLGLFMVSRVQYPKKIGSRPEISE